MVNDGYLILANDDQYIMVITGDNPCFLWIRPRSLGQIQCSSSFDSLLSDGHLWEKKTRFKQTHTIYLSQFQNIYSTSGCIPEVSLGMGIQQFLVSLLR